MSVRTVGSGQTYSTIQAALDNLYTTVGSVGFTETHTIQVYDGTYTETATPNTGLNPTSAFRLVFEAASGNTPIVDGQSTRANGFYIDAIDYVTVNGFIFTLVQLTTWYTVIEFTVTLTAVFMFTMVLTMLPFIIIFLYLMF